MAATVEPQARRAAVADELGVLADDAPVVPLFFTTGDFAHRPGVYDGWRFVKGTGLLNMRSFTDPFSPPPAKTKTPTGPSAPSSSSGLSPIGWAALGLGALTLVVAAAALVRGRR